jgi:hypothetical protein
MRYTHAAMAALLLATIPATVLSQEIAGEWLSDIDAINGTKARTVYEFSVDGSKLTGSVLGGARQEERPITNGKIKGNKISFSVQLHQGDRTFSFLYEGKIISADTIGFTVIHGTRIRAQFTARKLTQ